MPAKRYTFVLNFGYVESSRLGYMPWTSANSFKDAKAALLDLAAFLKEQYLLNTHAEPKKCCIATKNKDATAEYCTKCGCRAFDQEFDPENFIDWLRDLDTDTDTFSGYIEWEPHPKWQAGLLEGAPNQRFVYHAEWVIAAALGHHQHKDHTFETICKERTKSKKDSFSYY